jgi:tetratricopeptide (TPR) repeat protein
MQKPTEYQFDFLVSRRGTVGDFAADVAAVLEAEGYRVVVQDYDFKHGGDFVADIHDALISARNLFILHTSDYDQNIWTRKEFTNFFALIAASGGERRICVLRCDESIPRGILATTVFGDIVGVTDKDERRRIILAVAGGDALRQRREPTVFGGTIPQRNPHFTGRQPIIAQIQQILSGARDSQLVCVAICGLGGMGKTSLVRACVDVLGPDYAAVWWANAQTRQSLVSALAALAVRYEPHLQAEPEFEKLARIAIGRIERSERPVLLIFDNVESPQATDEFLPARGAHVLITSRWSDWGGRCHELNVDSLPEDEAIAFLQTRAGRKDEAGALKLARALGCLPLALDHAGAFVRSAMLSFDAYGRSLEKFLNRAPRDAPYPASVAATFTLAIETAARECAVAEAVLGHLAFFGAERIPLHLLPDSLISEDERAEALMALVTMSLVRSDPLPNDEPAVSLHRLVQAAARARLGAQGQAEAVVAQAAAILADALPDDAYDEPKCWPRCDELVAHCLAIRTHARALNVKTAGLAVLYNRIGKFLHGRAMFAAAEEFLREALSLAEAMHGQSSLEVAYAANDLANLLQTTARYAEAEPLLRKALLLQEQRLGRDDAGYARTMTSLAWLLHGTQRSEEAERLLREAISAGERSHGRSHPDVAVRLNNLALVQQSLGRVEEAEDLLREAIAAGEATQGRSHPMVITRLNNLANLLRDKGTLDEAEKLFREVVESTAQSLGREHPDFAVGLNNLGNVLRDRRQYAEAEPLYREAILILKDKFGQRDPLSARVERNLAILFVATGRAEEAATIAKSALAVHEQVLGQAHHWTLDSGMAYAEALAALNRADEAAALRATYQRAGANESATAEL